MGQLFPPPLSGLPLAGSLALRRSLEYGVQRPVLSVREHGPWSKWKYCTWFKLHPPGSIAPAMDCSPNLSQPWGDQPKRVAVRLVLSQSGDGGPRLSTE